MLFLSPHPNAGDREHAGGAGSVFFFSDPVDGANVIACVGRLMIGSLVFLGSRPILWLSSTIGYRERGQEGW